MIPKREPRPRRKRNKYSLRLTLLRVPLHGWETLYRMQRWPSILKKWIDSGRQVRIWSRYNIDVRFAGVFEMREAYEKTLHCGPEEKIYFQDVTP